MEFELNAFDPRIDTAPKAPEKPKGVEEWKTAKVSPFQAD